MHSQEVEHDMKHGIPSDLEAHKTQKAPRLSEIAIADTSMLKGGLVVSAGLETYQNVKRFLMLKIRRQTVLGSSGCRYV